MREKKIIPDLWEISCSGTRRRAGKAPNGAGVPVGRSINGISFAPERKKLNVDDYIGVSTDSYWY